MTDLADVKRRLWSAADELRANSTLTAAQYRDPPLRVRGDWTPPATTASV